MGEYEIWEPIAGYEGMYEISNFGNVRSLDRVGFQKNRHGGMSKYIHKGKTLKTTTTPNGYRHIDLHKDGEIKRHLIHRLVGLHFLEKPKGKDYINHLDANPTNNHVSNLEWCTQSENIQYAYNNGTKTPPHQRDIGQYDMEGNLIKVWHSMTEVERELHIFQANIYKVCSGKRKQTGGFKWQYIK